MSATGASQREMQEEIAELRRRLDEARAVENKCLAMEREMAKSQAILAAAIEQTPVGFIVAEAPDGRVRLASLEALGILAKPAGLDQAPTLEELFQGWQMFKPDGTPYPFEERPLVKAALHGEPSRDLEAIIRRENGEEHWVRVNAAPVLDQAGRLVAGVVVFHDITPVKTLEAERARTLSFFAHDIKSPLMAAKSLLLRLTGGKLGSLDPRQMEYLRIISAQNDRAISLALDFLDVARLAKSGGALTLAPVDLAALLGELADEYAVRAREAGLAFLAELPATLPVVMADAGRLRRALANLLDNAVSYSAAGEVTLRAAPAPNGLVEVAVLDQGPGMTAEDLAHLFEPFHRGNAGKGKEGSGLGLAAVRSIVEAHGGWVEGRNRDSQGAQFRVVLPAGRA